MGLDAVLLLAGAVLFAVGLLSRLLKRVFLSGVLVALVIGVVVGPEVLGLLDPTEAGDERGLMEEVARVTLALALMGAGLQLTRQDLRENLRPTVVLLTGGMLGMWVLTGLGGWLLLDLPFWVGFLLGAVLTPTDPVVASTLVTGPLAEDNLPRRLRRTLQMEAGANDGLAVPFVLAAAYFAATGTAGVDDWALEALQEVGLAVIVGGALGLAAGYLVEVSFQGAEIEDTSLLGMGLALALLVLGLVSLLGGSGILAVFVAAIVFSVVIEARVREVVEEVQETITRFLLLPAFVLFGAILPFGGWSELGLAGIAFVLWVLFLRRLPVVPAALRLTDVPARSRWFLGWFGPLGVAAIYYATYVERYHLPEGERLFAAATLAICASVVVHSITATPLVRLHAGRSPFATLRHPLKADSETAP